jgi:hypothetical protein
MKVKPEKCESLHRAPGRPALFATLRRDEGEQAWWDPKGGDLCL